tara:strand:+ start:9572 stop:9877 length:306 start_codon:yes stop_codon:yes gene_type:complete
MKFLKILKNKKIVLLNIFLILYVAVNLIGGERGLVSYLEKNNKERQLSLKYDNLVLQLEQIENKNKLLSSNLNLDYLDKLYREKLKFGLKDEIIIKLNNEK